MLSLEPWRTIKRTEREETREEKETPKMILKHTRFFTGFIHYVLQENMQYIKRYKDKKICKS